MASFGKIEQFTPGEDWPEYVERLQFYFSAHDITDDDKKKAILLSVCGKNTCSLIRRLLAPAKPDTKTFTEIVDTVAAHESPKPSVIVQRYKFNTRTRQPGETVSAYVAALRGGWLNIVHLMTRKRC